MLRYATVGERRYGDNPVSPYKRGVVEFEIIATGTARPLRADGTEGRALSPCLWVHGPESEHGWTDDPGQRSTVMVLHFWEGSPHLLRVLGEKGSVQIPLRKEELRWAETTVKKALEEVRRPSTRTWLWLESVRAELGLIAMRGLPDLRETALDPWAALKVEQAIHWYRERLRDAPTVTETARAVGTSPTHLRRLFATVRGESPHAVFLQLRLDLARQEIRSGGKKIAEIAERIGFSEPSAFSRAYRKGFGHSPQTDRNVLH
jgi:AraC-like DNA-binding protein